MTDYRKFVCVHVCVSVCVCVCVCVCVRVRVYAEVSDVEPYSSKVFHYPCSAPLILSYH